MIGSIQQQRRAAVARVWFVGQVAAGCMVAMVVIALLLDAVAWLRRISS